MNMDMNNDNVNPGARRVVAVYREHIEQARRE
jgi:hypothetical protein